MCVLMCVCDAFIYHYLVLGVYSSCCGGHRGTRNATLTKTEYQIASIFSKQLHLHAGKAGMWRGGELGREGGVGVAISRVAQTPRRSPFINYLISD